MSVSAEGLARLACLAALSCAAPAFAQDLVWPGHEAAVEAAIAESVDGEVRAERLRRVAELDSAAAARLIARSLDDRSAPVRAAACDMVRARPGGVDVAAIHARLSDRRASVRAACAAALAAVGDPTSVEVLARTLADPDVAVRAAAARALGAFGSPDAASAAAVALQDRHRDVVVAALDALAQLRQPTAVYAVLERADDPSAQVAEAAVRALIELRVPEALPSLIRAARTGTPEVASLALDGLALYGTREALPAIVAEVLSPRSPQSATAASRALASLADPGAAARVSPLLRSNPERVADYFAAIGPAGWPSLREAWRAETRDAQDPLAEVWLRSGDPEAVDQISVLLDDQAIDAVFTILSVAPSAQAVCAAASRVRVPEELAAPQRWFLWAAEGGALACVEPFLGVADAWALQERHGVAVALASGPSRELAAYVEQHVDADRLDPLEVSALARVLVETGAGHVVAPWLGARDERTRARTAFALAQAPVPEVVPTLEALPARAETVRALRPLWGEPAAAALVDRYLGHDDPAVRAAAIHAAAASCGSLPSSPARAAAGGSSRIGFALRRAYVDHATRCASSLPPLGERGDRDLARRMLDLRAMGEDAVRDVLLDASAPAALRVSALRSLMAAGSDDAAIAAARAAQDPALVAAAWGFGPWDEAAAQAALSRWRHPVLAAVYAARSPDPLPALVQQSEAPRVFERFPYAAPFEVSLVDRETGSPRFDQHVFGVTCEGEVVVSLSDALGAARFHDEVDGQVCFVWVQP